MMKIGGREVTFGKLYRKALAVAWDRARHPFMSADGLHPKGTFVVSRSGNKWNNCLPSAISLPNLSTYYHPVLRAFWEFHGLGDKCLLVSENSQVKALMQSMYPGTQFLTTDYYPELMAGHTDVVWDVCLAVPPEMQQLAPFGSIIANALMEHLISPTRAFESFFGLLRPQGHLYVLTHTPSFPLHRYPRDYTRFHHDYFEDLPQYVNQTRNVAVELKELWSRRGQVIACYERK